MARGGRAEAERRAASRARARRRSLDASSAAACQQKTGRGAEVRWCRTSCGAVLARATDAHGGDSARQLGSAHHASSSELVSSPCHAIAQFPLVRGGSHLRRCRPGGRSSSRHAEYSRAGRSLHGASAVLVALAWCERAGDDGWSHQLARAGRVRERAPSALAVREPDAATCPRRSRDELWPDRLCRHLPALARQDPAAAHRCALLRRRAALPRERHALPRVPHRCGQPANPNPATPDPATRNPATLNPATPHPADP